MTPTTKTSLRGAGAAAPPAPAASEASGAAAGPAWHTLTPEAALDAAGSAPGGLSAGEAAARLRRVGPNVLPRGAGEGPLRLLWRQVNNPLIWVLLASAGLALTAGKWIDGAVVLGVVVLNTLIGFVQEYRACRAIAALLDLVPETATVLRDGARVALPAAEGIGDRRNLAYGGTLVTAGAGAAVVVAPAGATELGRIDALLRTATHLETPLTRQIAVVGRWLTGAIVLLATVLVGVGLLRGYPLLDAVLAGITLAVGAIPEGLPAIITIALAIGMQRMSAWPAGGR